MKIRDAQGRFFTPGVIADIPTGNLLWVDPVNGNDTLALPGRLTVPFKTLTKAKETSVSGDTIIVLPGLYDEGNLLKNGVNWHFLPGARVDYDGSYAIFDDGANGANGTVECVIGGVGEFWHRGTGSAQAVLYTTNSNTKLHLVCARIFGNEQGIVCVNGSQLVEVLGDFQGLITAQNGQVNLRSRRLFEVYCIVSGGTHWISAQEGSPVAGELSGGSLFWEVPRTIGFPVDPAFWLQGGVLRLINTVVIAGEDLCSPGYGITVQDGAKCIFKNSHVIDNEHTYAVTGDGEIVCLGSVWSNKALDPSLTNLTNAYQSYFYDADVEF